MPIDSLGFHFSHSIPFAVVAQKQPTYKDSRNRVIKIIKNRPCLEVNSDFNMFLFSLMRMGEAGLHDYWTSKYVKKTDRCNLDKYQEENSKPRAIKLVELSSPFLVLCIGLGLSALTFLIERVVFYGKKIREQRKQEVIIIFSHVF